MLKVVSGVLRILPWVERCYINASLSTWTEKLSHIFIFRRQTIEFGETLTTLIFTLSTASTPVSNELIEQIYFQKSSITNILSCVWSTVSALPLAIIIRLTAQSCPDLPVWLLGRICVYKEPCNTMVILKQTQGHALSLTNRFLSFCHWSHDWLHISTGQDLEVTYILLLVIVIYKITAIAFFLF